MEAEPDSSKRAARVARGTEKWLLCNGRRSSFSFRYSVHINTSENTSLEGGDRGCRESV